MSSPAADQPVLPLAEQRRAFEAAFDELSDRIGDLGEPSARQAQPEWRARFEQAASAFEAAADGFNLDGAPAELRGLAAPLRKLRKESRRLARATRAAVHGDAASFAVAAYRGQQLKRAVAEVTAILDGSPGDQGE